MIGEELYRQGFQTLVVCGPCENKPRTASDLRHVSTTMEMLRECKAAENSGLCGGVFCASVLDYEPTEKTMGKLKSGRDNLTITFKPTPKIIEDVAIKAGAKIGFKLEVGLSDARAKTMANEYITKYKLTAIIANELTAVSDRDHKATAFLASSDQKSPLHLNSKADIATFISKLIAQHARADHPKS
jgi:phosphopantothenoylcysteine synthetase/decarboxylase